MMVGSHHWHHDVLLSNTRHYAAMAVTTAIATVQQEGPAPWRRQESLTVTTVTVVSALGRLAGLGDTTGSAGVGPGTAATSTTCITGPGQRTVSVPLTASLSVSQLLLQRA